MRVTAGSARGRRLTVPKNAPLRPTASRTKEAMFSMVESCLAAAEGAADIGTPELWAGLRVLDLYAGSGALGIEALSRGAAGVTFVESDREAGVAIRQNLAATRFEAAGTLVSGTLPAALGRVRGRFDVGLMDPPYADPALSAVATEAAALLADNAILALEHSSRLILPDTLGALTHQRTRRHGDTALSLYARGRYARSARREAEVI